MKKTLLLGLTLISLTLNAQSKYESGMKKALEQYGNAKTIDDYMATSALFERIADAEKDKWLPYYYAALTNQMTVWMDEKSDKDKISEKSILFIEKAELLESNNSEIFCVRQMIAIAQMSVDPMSRWQTYGAQANKALESAKKADPNNPRIYFLEGQSIYNTPVAFGGGKKNAKPLFQKSVELYGTFVAASDFHPNWGKEDAANMLKECE
ncbi:MAG: hypothetical protein V4622_08960 [Bacteroidota bacterium]